MTIKFRQLNDNVQPGWMPGLHWQVELYADDNGTLSYPLALAWVTDSTPFTPQAPLVGLDFIIVMDQFRRQGHAEKLIAACKERWPGIHLTNAISREGQALLDKVEPDRANPIKEIQRAVLRQKRDHRKKLSKMKKASRKR